MATLSIITMTKTTSVGSSLSIAVVPTKWETLACNCAEVRAHGSHATPHQPRGFAGLAHLKDCTEHWLIALIRPKPRMTLVAVLIYSAVITICVGLMAGAARAWTRRHRWHEGPSDLHYIIVGVALVVSAAFGFVVASQIVVALGHISQWRGSSVPGPTMPRAAPASGARSRPGSSSGHLRARGGVG